MMRGNCAPALQFQPKEAAATITSSYSTQPHIQPERHGCLVSFAAVLLVVASAGFGMLFAWQVGSKHDASCLARPRRDGSGPRLSKPFAILQPSLPCDSFASSPRPCSRSWDSCRRLRLQAELSFMTMTRGDLVAERAGVRDAAHGRRTLQKLDADLAALKPTSSKERDMAVYLERRDALQADLHQAEQDRRHAPAVSVPDPGAVALATYAASLA